MRKPSILVIGPQAENTILTQEISKYYQNVLITPETVLNEKFKSELEEGKCIENERLNEQILAKITSDESKFKGFSADCLTEIAKSRQQFKQFLTSVAHQDGHLFIVNVKANIEKVKEKLSNQKIDPLSLSVYSKEQIELSKQPIPEEQEEKQEDDEKEPEDDEEKYIPIDPFEKHSIPKVTRMDSTRINSLVQRFEDFSSQLTLKMQQIESFSQLFQDFKSQVSVESDFVSWIDIDAEESGTSVLQNICSVIEQFGYDKKTNQVQVATFDATDGLEVDDLNWSKVKTFKMQENEPPREDSPWIKYDPVVWLNEKVLKTGLQNFCAVYKGQVFVFSTEENQQSFQVNPEKYLKSKPETVGFNWALVGNSSSRTSECAKQLAATYKFGYLNAEDYLKQMFDNPSDKLDKLHHMARDELVAGREIPSDFYVGLLKSHISSNPRGCVFDQFPITSSQLERLIAHEYQISKVADLVNASQAEFSFVNDFIISEKNPLVEEAIKQHQNTVLINHQTRMNQLSSDTGIVSTIQLDAPVADLNFVKWAVDPLLTPPVSVAFNDVLPQLFGEFKNYCPVALKDRNCVQLGKADFAVKYQSKIYQMSSEIEKNRFMQNPDFYLNQKLPEPKICIVGITGSGCSTQANRLAAKFNLDSISFSEFSLKFPETRGFVLTDFLKNKQQADALKETGLVFDTVLKLKLDADESFARMRKIAAKNPLQKIENEEKLQQDLIAENVALEEVSGTYLKEVATIEVPSVLSERIVSIQVDQALAYLTSDRYNLLVQATELPTALDIQLKFGTLRLSDYRYECPVEINRNVIAKRDSKGSVPVVVGDTIYVVKEANKKEFIERTAKYLERPALLPQIRPQVLVISNLNNPNASLLASFVAKQFDLVLVTPESLVTTFSQKELNQDSGLVRDLLNSGKSIDEQILQRLVKFAMGSLGIYKNGWVMAGFPFSIEKIEALDISPNIVLNLEENLNIEPPIEHAFNQQNYEIPIQNTWNSKFKEFIRPLVEKYSSSNKLVQLECKSLWTIKTKTVQEIKEKIASYQEFNQRKLQGKASCIEKTTVPTVVWKQRLAQFKNYCPVSFVDDKKLVECEQNLSNTAEFNSFYYSFSSPEYMQRFIQQPLKYSSKEFVQKLPKRIDSSQFRQMFPIEIAYKGYCPVTFKRGNMRFESLIEGSNDFLVFYDSSVYSFASSSNLEIFMATPWEFVGQTLPSKLPPKKLSVPVSNLPVIGYLEQSVSDALNSALLSCGRMKPKYPFKSLQDSAIEYLGLYLKANNEKAKPWIKQSFQTRLADFESKCTELQKLSEKVTEYQDQRLVSGLLNRLTRN